MSELTRDQEAMILIGSLTLENAKLQAANMTTAERLNNYSENNRVLTNENTQLKVALKRFEDRFNEQNRVQQANARFDEPIELEIPKLREASTVK